MEPDVEELDEAQTGAEHLAFLGSLEETRALITDKTRWTRSPALGAGGGGREQVDLWTGTPW